MKIASPGELKPFTPFDQMFRPKAERVVYHFTAPSAADEARFERAVAEAGGRQWSWWELHAALEQGVRQILTDEADPERAGVLAVLAEVRDSATSAVAGLADTSRADDEAGRADLLRQWEDAVNAPRLAEIDALVTPVYPRLAQMQADNRLFAQIRGTVACRLFLAGWENVSGEVRRGLGGADDETIRRVKREHRAAIGAWCDTLFGPTETEAKNSVSPSAGS